MSENNRYDAILLIGFGGPTNAGEIEPFLDIVLEGRSIPPQRYAEVVNHYRAIGSRSPYNDWTMRQAGALHQLLRSQGIEIPVMTGMRNWRPFLADSVRVMGLARMKRVLGFIMAPHQSEASWDRYLESVSEACRAAGPSAPEFDYVRPYYNHPQFIEAVAAQAREAITRFNADEREAAQMIFTAHSIPAAMASAGRYVEQITESSRLVAAALNRDAWSVAYQSRSGSPREPWLEPDIRDALRGLEGKPAVVVPIGFLCDHVEVLYDLDVDAARVAYEAGVHMERAATVGDHPAFIRMMADLVRERFALS